jgi:phosphoribosylglycinamide formyltransferase-1
LLDASERGELGDAAVVVLVADRVECGALAIAAEAGVGTLVLDPASYPGREAYGEAMAAELRGRGVDLVCMAGFMRILPPGFIAAFEGRVLNIHPALLPAFPGPHPVRDTLAWGVRVSGSTVHFADEAVDHGPILAQECVPVLQDDDEASLHERIKAVEHRLYPAAVRLVVEGRTTIEGRRVLIDAAEGLAPGPGAVASATRGSGGEP